MYDWEKMDMVAPWLMEYYEACEEADRLEEERLEEEATAYLHEEDEYEDEDEYPGDCDDWDIEMGFDPYEGLYTYDC